MTNQEFIESIRLEGEEWRDVVGYENHYMVSSFGRVIRKYTSLPRSDGHNTAVTYPRLLRQTIRKCRKQRYYYVTLSANNKQRKMLVHKIVALAFIPNPLSKTEIDHIDGNGLNNHISNLRWCTHSENNMNPIARRRQSESHKGKVMSSLWVPVVCISKSGEIKHYRSISEAEKDGFKRNSIISSCRNVGRKIRKRQWMYLSDYENLVSMSKNSSKPGDD